MRAAFREVFAFIAILFASLGKFASSFYKVATWVDQESGNLLEENVRLKAEQELVTLCLPATKKPALPAPSNTTTATTTA